MDNWVCAMIRRIIQDQDLVRFDRTHFQGYGEFALTFETACYVLSPNYNVYMDIQQAINIEIFRQFEDRFIRFAYPTQAAHFSASNVGENLQLSLSAAIQSA